RCPVQNHSNRRRFGFFWDKKEKALAIGRWLILGIFRQCEQRARVVHLECRSQPYWHGHQLPIERNVEEFFAVAAPFRPSAAAVKSVYSTGRRNLPLGTRIGKAANVYLPSPR